MQTALFKFGAVDKQDRMVRDLHKSLFDLHYVRIVLEGHAVMHDGRGEKHRIGAEGLGRLLTQKPEEGVARRAIIAAKANEFEAGIGRERLHDAHGVGDDGERGKGGQQRQHFRDRGGVIKDDHLFRLDHGNCMFDDLPLLIGGTLLTIDNVFLSLDFVLEGNASMKLVDQPLLGQQVGVSMDRHPAYAEEIGEFLDAGRAGFEKHIQDSLPAGFGILPFAEIGGMGLDEGCEIVSHSVILPSLFLGSRHGIVDRVAIGPDVRLKH